MMRVLGMSVAMVALVGLAACEVSERKSSTPVDTSPTETASADTAVAPPDIAAGDDVGQPRSGYTPVPIGAEDQPGRPRQVRCQVGDDPETDCTFTPLFGDGSFQLDGPDIAYRLVVDGEEGWLFAVFDAEERTGVGGVYRRDARDRACWKAMEDTPAPSRICAR